jgi:hypothetical protein
MDERKEAYEQRRQKATEENSQAQVQKAASSYPHRAPQAQVTRVIRVRGGRDHLGVDHPEFLESSAPPLGMF